jgi:hypothetical protein
VTKKITELDHKQTVFRMKDIAEELDRLSKKDTLTGEDEVRWADFNDEFSQLDSHRKHIEREDDLSRIRSAMNSPFGKSESGVGASDYNDDPIGDPRSVEDLKRSRNPWDLSDIKTFGRSKALVNADIRDRALAAIEKMPFANDRVRQASTEIIEQFDDSKASLSRLCLAASSPEYIRAWSKCAAGREHMLSNEERDALERAMSLTDSAGGYLVPFQLDPTVIITANGSRNEIRQIARQVVAIGDTWNGVSSGAVSWSWDAEATEVSDDSTTFGQPSISVYKAAGFVPIRLLHSLLALVQASRSESSQL